MGWKLLSGSRGNTALFLGLCNSFGTQPSSKRRTEVLRRSRLQKQFRDRNHWVPMGGSIVVKLRRAGKRSDAGVGAFRSCSSGVARQSCCCRVRLLKHISRSSRKHEPPQLIQCSPCFGILRFVTSATAIPLVAGPDLPCNDTDDVNSIAGDSMLALR